MDIKQKIGTMVALCAAFALTVGVATAAAGNGGTSQTKLCDHGGWQTVYGTNGTTFTSQFTSQKDCVAFVAGGGTLLVRFGSLIDCENLGGTYTTVDPVWRCLGIYFPDQAHATAAYHLLYADCAAEGGMAYTSVGTIPGTTDAWCHA